ncbi:MAG: sugar transferase [Desulfobacterales bacterium]
MADKPRQHVQNRVRKLKFPPYKYVFLGLDLLVLTVAFFYGLDRGTPDFWGVSRTDYYYCLNHITLLFIYLAIFVFTFRYFSLYKRQIVTTRRLQLLQLIKALTVAGAVSIIFLVVVNAEYLATNGKQLLFYFLTSSGVLFVVYRGILGKNLFWLLVKNKILSRNILIIGGDKEGIAIAKKLMHDPYSDLTVVGFLDDYKEKGKTLFEDYRNLGHLEDLGDVVENLGVDEIIVAINNAPYDRLIHIVKSALKTGVSTRIYADLLKVVAEKLDVELYNGVSLVELQEKPLSSNPWKDKRTFDILLAAVAIILLGPVFMVIAIGIKLSSKGPVFYKQTRVGRGGKSFDFYKFRSMHVDSDPSIHQEYVKNFINGKVECADKNIKVFKITDDPRIFTFGKFIRKTSLDEFPQFFNVLKGDMTLVGPRPCLPYEWECYEDWHKKRLTSLPGCTGIWQALGRSSVSFEEMVVLDLYYISNVSLWLDFKIILKTIPVIFFAKGGH